MHCEVTLSDAKLDNLKDDKDKLIIIYKQISLVSTGNYFP